MLLRQHYAGTPTAALAQALGRTAGQVYQAADRYGLKKSAASLESDAACRLRRGDNVGADHRFTKGQAAWNKGVKGSTGGANSSSFKAGNKPKTWVPVGATRVDERDGYVVRKVSDTGSRKADWRPLHVLAWEAANGPVPAGSIVVFKPGRKTTDVDAVTTDAIECITRRENMLRNTYHRYGPEVAKLVQLRGAITRQINKRAEHEQDHQ